MLIIKKINIEKFRSIEKCSICVSELTALVGANNSGKSSILRGLNAFFNYEEEAEDFILKKHEYSPKTRSAKIELVFEFRPKKRRVDSRIRVPKNLREFYCRASNSFIIQLSHGKKTHSYKYKKNGVYEPAPNDIISKIKKHIEYVFIPPARDHNKVKWQNDTLLHSLVHEFLKIETQSRDTFSSKFREAAKYLESHALKKISKEIKNNYVLNHDFSFDIKYAKNLTYKEFLQNLLFFITEKGLTHELKDCGSGIQSVIIISLYHTLAKLKKKTMVIGIEEPETHLHPQAQKEFLSSLLKFTENGQILLTTHSSVITDKVSHEQIVLFRKKEHNSRGFVTEVTSIQEDFWSKYNIEDFRYYQFHHYRNSDFFFAKFVILCESKNDIQIIEQLLLKEKWDLSLNSFSLIDLDGVENLKYGLSLVKELNLPYLVIVDKDFFMPYSKNKFKDSIGNDGYPQYEYRLKDHVEQYVTNSNDRQDLLQALHYNYKNAIDILFKYNFISMRYSLEIDILSSANGRKKMGTMIQGCSDDSLFNLVSNNGNTIKDIKKLSKIVEVLSPREYPRSFSYIKNYLIDKLNKLTK